MDKVTLKIPRPLYERLKKVIEPSGFSSVNEFVVFILRDLMSRVETAGESRELTAEEINAIRTRLHNLGYL
jgi:metal-responsive CopG/Arc/MetJ family transcriptional regulator